MQGDMGGEDITKVTRDQCKGPGTAVWHSMASPAQNLFLPIVE